ncbi:MAG: glycerol-3-phosphate 1-O-acyltransferase PlsY [bacterium]|nr:glycerol-3-phosphate 1-O-acyltransferase PlsY [bacterium]
MIAETLITLVLAFFAGSVPFALLTTRWLGRPDPRLSGSGNIGATNVLRTSGKTAGIATLAGDILKGTLAVYLLPLLLAAPEESRPIASLAAAGAVCGHIFSPFAGFKGGKGVATGLGAMAVLTPAPVAIAALVFAGAVALTRYVALGSMLGAVAVPVAALLTGAPPPYPLTATVIGLLIIWRHKENIRRLLQGEENRLGGGRPAAEDKKP